MGRKAGLSDEKLRAVPTDDRTPFNETERLVIELADLRGHPARLIARRHKAMLEGHLAELLARAGVASPRELAREIWLLSEGAISLILVHGDRGYAAAAAAAARKLIRARPAIPAGTSRPGSARRTRESV